MRWLKILVLASGAVAGCAQRPAPTAPPGPGMATEPEAALSLPVASVTVFTSGLTYIEHKGALRGPATAELRVKSGQAEDVLKSLLVAAEDGASVAASVKTLEPPQPPASPARRFDLSEGLTLVKLLEQLRGVPVRLVCAGENVDATILSLEKKEESVGEKRIEAYFLNLLSGSGSIRAVAMEKVQRVELNDARVQQELNRALAGSEQAPPAEEHKRIAVSLHAEGEQAIRLGYAVSSQAWKIKYRLLLTDKPSIQAWANVGNETEYDWKDVRLNLTSAKAISLSGDSGTDYSDVSSAGRAPGAPAGSSLRWPTPFARRDALEQGAEKTAAQPKPTPGALVDPVEAFRFVAQGVTIPRKGAAVVLVMSGPVSAEPVAVYNEKLAKRNPLQGARIRNTTSQYLLEGNLTVVDRSGLLGDGTLANLPPGRDCLVTWGIDLPLLVDASQNLYEAGVGGGRLQAGLLHLIRTYTYAKPYVIENEGQKDRVVIVEHPIRRGYALAESKELIDRTESLYRFQKTVPAGQRVSLLVREQAMEAEVIDLIRAETPTLLMYSQEEGVPEVVRVALAKAAGLKRQFEERQRQIQQIQADLGQAAREQARLRENLKSAEGKLKDELQSKLQQEESRIETLNKQLALAKEEAQKARKEFEGYLASLNVG